MFREAGPGMEDPKESVKHTTSKRLKDEFGMKTDVQASDVVVLPDDSEYEMDIAEQFLPSPVQLALDFALKNEVKRISLDIDGVEYKVRSVGSGGNEKTLVVYKNNEPVSLVKSALMREPHADEDAIAPWETFVEPAANAVMHLPGAAEGAENITQVRSIMYDTENNIGRVEFEFANGGDIGQISKEGLLGKQKPEVAAALLEDAARGLRYMHRAELMHRDIKPANIVLHKDTSGVVRAQLTDFGLVSTVPQEQMLTSHLLVGSAPFMDKDVLEYHRTPRSDIYALGMSMAVSLFGMKEVWDSFVKEKTGKDPENVTSREGFNVARQASAGELHKRVKKLLRSSYEQATPEMKKVYDAILAMLDPGQPVDLDAVVTVAHEAAAQQGGGSALLETIFPVQNTLAEYGPESTYVKFRYDAISGSVVPPPPESASHSAFEDGEDEDNGSKTVNLKKPRAVTSDTIVEDAA